MVRRKKTTPESKNKPQVGNQLTVDERLKILANLIVDQVLEKRMVKQGKAL